MSSQAANGEGMGRSTTGGEGRPAGGPPSIDQQLVAAMQAAEALDAALMAEVAAGRSNLRHAQRVKRDIAAAIRSLAWLRDHGAAIKSAVAYVRAQPDLVRKFADAGAEIYDEHMLDGSTVDIGDAASRVSQSRGSMGER